MGGRSSISFRVTSRLNLSLKAALATAMILFIPSCIEPYMPEIEETTSSYVITGQITDIPGTHFVQISKSLSHEESKYRPVEGCVVTVEDELGNIRVYRETDPGSYEAELEAPFLGVGKAYSIHVITPRDEEYHSDFDTLFPCPPLDSFYYEVDDGSSPRSGGFPGVQFYTDFKGQSEDARGFRYTLFETWEYVVPNEPDLVAYEDSGIVKYSGPPMQTCYRSEKIPLIIAASTLSFDENILSHFPLYYVNNQTTRLSIRYSVLLEQHSLSYQAYVYWSRLKTTSYEPDLFFETEPSNTYGNLYRVDDPDEEVLGIFYASQVQGKRITVSGKLPFSVHELSCKELFRVDSLDSPLLSGIQHYPYYLLTVPSPSDTSWIVWDRGCVDCTAYGGVTEKPDFW